MGRPFLIGAYVSRYRGVMYLRKSNLKNADNDLAAHDQRISAVVKLMGVPFERALDLYQEPDGHRSGTEEKHRPEFRRMMERVTRKDSDVAFLFANDRSRIWRNDKEFIRFLEEVKRLGVMFIPVAESPVMDISTPMGYASEGMMALFNAWYAKEIGKKRKDQYAALRERTWYVSPKAPMGLKNQGRGMDRRTVISEATHTVDGIEHLNLDTPREFYRLFSENKDGLRLIARSMRERGFWWVHGEHVSPVTVRNLHRSLRNIRIYHETGAIDDELYERVQRVVALRSQPVTAGRKPNVTYLLTRALYCSACGKLLSTECGLKYEYALYRHQDSNCSESRSVLCHKTDDAFIEKIVYFNSVSDELRHKIVESRETKQVKDDSRERAIARRKRLETQKENLYDSYLAGDMGLPLEAARPRYLDKLKKIDAELATLPLEAPEPARFDTDGFFAGLETLQFSLATGVLKDSKTANALVRSLFPRLKYNLDTRTFLFPDEFSL